MTWIKLDDQTPDHPKIAGLTDRAFRWWMRGLCYASRYLTDGVLAKVFWKQAPSPVRAELTTAKLWDWHDPDFHIHDYLEHQQSREAVETERRRQRDRRQADRGAADRRTPGTTGVRSDENTRPPIEGEVEKEKIQKTDHGGAPSAPRPQPIIDRRENQKWDKKHGYHVAGFCNWCCFDEEQFREFAAKIPGDDHALKAKQLLVWAHDIRRQWSDRIIPDGSHFDFWRNRWTETHGGSKPANATLKAAKAAADLDEAFR